MTSVHVRPQKSATFPADWPTTGPQKTGEAERKRRRSVGIEVRHALICPARERKGARCNCRPSYRAWVYDLSSGKKIRRSFPTEAAARSWRAEAQVAVGRRTLQAATPKTLRDAAEELIAGMRTGLVRTRSGDAYKPSAIRSYEAALRLHVLRDLGARRLGDVSRRDLQRLADRMLADKQSPSTIRNALLPVRVIYRRALEDGEVAVNPTNSLRLPASRGRRERIATLEEAERLLAVLPGRDRALWATAFYAGLRRGELMGLLWEDVDLASGVIRVERSWDVKEGPIEPKSSAGRRTVPIPAILRDYLLAHKLDAVSERGLIFGRTETRPFEPVSVGARAAVAWTAANAENIKRGAKERELKPITLHEARHTFASLMIAAGVDMKALSTYMGHSSITITLDRYGHLLPGSESEAAALLDAYLERANTRARKAVFS